MSSVTSPKAVLDDEDCVISDVDTGTSGVCSGYAVSVWTPTAPAARFRGDEATGPQRVRLKLRSRKASCLALSCPQLLQVRFDCSNPRKTYMDPGRYSRCGLTCA
jgi:hypothetical protein